MSLLDYPLIGWSLGEMAVVANIAFIDKLIKDTIREQCSMLGKPFNNYQLPSEMGFKVLGHE